MGPRQWNHGPFFNNVSAVPLKPSTILALLQYDLLAAAAVKPKVAEGVQRRVAQTGRLAILPTEPELG
jgi:hypothetical protein